MYIHVHVFGILYSVSYADSGDVIILYSWFIKFAQCSIFQKCNPYLTYPGLTARPAQVLFRTLTQTQPVPSFLSPTPSQLFNLIYLFHIPLKISPFIYLSFPLCSVMFIVGPLSVLIRAVSSLSCMLDLYSYFPSINLFSFIFIYILHFSFSFCFISFLSSFHIL